MFFYSIVRNTTLNVRLKSPLQTVTVDKDELVLKLKMGIDEGIANYLKK
jgi:hypothetical protein